MNKLTPRQIAALPPEKRARYEANMKRVARNRKILTVLVGLIVVAIVAVALSMTVLFNITKINVSNSGKHYTDEEIISASGLDIGDNMVRTDFGNAQFRIQKNLPYVMKAEITKKLTGVITIKITDDIAAMAFECQSGYAITDSDAKVLNIIDKLPPENDYTIVKTKERVNAVMGETIEFSEKGHDSEIYALIEDGIEESGIKNITKIDISDPNSIKLEYQNRFRLKLGNSADISTKLIEAVKVIAQEDETDKTTVAEINLSILKKIYVNPLDSLKEKPKEKTTKTEKTTQSETTEN